MDAISSFLGFAFNHHLLFSSSANQSLIRYILNLLLSFWVPISPVFPSYFYLCVILYHILRLSCYFFSYMYVCVGVHTCICISMWSPEDNQGCHSSDAIHQISQASRFKQGQWAPGITCFYLLSAGITSALCLSWLIQHGFWGLNSGLHACGARTLSTESVPLAPPTINFQTTKSFPQWLNYFYIATSSVQESQPFLSPC